MIKLYNTLTRSIEDFKPISDGQVKLYTCGPTVYDNQTIGNLRTYVLYDTLHRTLENSGYMVKHVMNITDVGHLTSDADEGEDKLERGAKKSGKNVWEVSAHYTDEFLSDLDKLNINRPTLAKATDYILQQIEMVQILLDKGFAYQSEQAIYFDVRKLNDYGRLTGQNLRDKEVGARSEVITDKNKRNPQDFALWFFTTGHFKEHTMHWPSPWGEGFPGWHLECSAIIHATLHDPIDIHAGAVDLIGTHHTNEMAQTEAAYGNHLANFWLHSEHLLVNNQRMGKSLGNFYTLSDVKNKGFDYPALRLLYLQAHYRSQLNFTWEGLEAAAQNLNNLRAWADLVHQTTANREEGTVVYTKLLDALQDDLNTPKALAILNESTDRIKPDKELLEKIDKLFGLGLSERSNITNGQKELITERQTARENGDWTRADELRSKLSEQGIEINDTPNGPVWYRT